MVNFYSLLVYQRVFVVSKVQIGICDDPLDFWNNIEVHKDETDNQHQMSIVTMTRSGNSRDVRLRAPLGTSEVL